MEKDPNATQAQKDAAEEAARKASEAARKTPEGKALTEAEKAQNNIPVHTGGAEVSNPDPQAPQACREMQSFLAGCNDSGWKTGGCQLFLAKLQGCADPRITNPGPEDDATCGLPAVDPEEAKRVSVLMCQMATRPAPDEDPCAPLPLEGELYRYRYGAKGPPCGDPRARTGEDQCLPNHHRGQVQPKPDSAGSRRYSTEARGADHLPPGAIATRPGPRARAGVAL